MSNSGYFTLPRDVMFRPRACGRRSGILEPEQLLRAAIPHQIHVSVPIHVMGHGLSDVDQGLWIARVQHVPGPRRPLEPLQTGHQIHHRIAVEVRQGDIPAVGFLHRFQRERSECHLGRLVAGNRMIGAHGPCRQTGHAACEQARKPVVHPFVTLFQVGAHGSVSNCTQQAEARPPQCGSLGMYFQTAIRSKRDTVGLAKPSNELSNFILTHRTSRLDRKPKSSVGHFGFSGSSRPRLHALLSTTRTKEPAMHQPTSLNSRSHQLASVLYRSVCCGPFYPCRRGRAIGGRLQV